MTCIIRENFWLFSLRWTKELRNLVAFTHPWLQLLFSKLSHVRLFATPWTAPHQASLSFTVSQSLLNLKSIELMMPFNHLIHCCPLLLLPSIFPSVRVFSNESALTSSAQSSVLQLQHQHFQWIFRIDFFLDRLVWAPWSPRDSQESSPPPQFESISSLAHSRLYGSTLTSIHDYWKNHHCD